MNGRTLMIQGTMSHAGKTLVVAALCRILARQGLRVAPFKAQNMSLNSHVTPDGKEIARAQAMQALAAGVTPVVEMNPILLKPKGNTTSQVVLLGRPYGDFAPEDYYDDFVPGPGIDAVKKCLAYLLSRFDAVVIEGAGSPAEINLYGREIANMKVARLADAPVFLVADIDRGGVFASIVGTISLLKAQDRRRVKGIIINKFRGDERILEPGLRKVEGITGKPVLGVIPYMEGLDLPWEDSVSLEELQEPKGRQEAPEVVVIRLPLISNFTDVHPLIVKGARVRWAGSREEVGRPDAIVIPGTKNTVHDLLWIREKGIDEEILAQRKRGVPILGICGGYQMLGKKLVDSKGIEGGKAGAEYPGLGLLDVVTEFREHDKQTRRVTAEVSVPGPLFASVTGRRFGAYEIHMGETKSGRVSSPFRVLLDSASSRPDGAISRDGLVLGCYLHGLFDDDAMASAFLDRISHGAVAGEGGEDGRIEKTWESSLDLFCATFLDSVDIERMLKAAGMKPARVRDDWILERAS